MTEQVVSQLWDSVKLVGVFLIVTDLFQETIDLENGDEQKFDKNARMVMPQNQTKFYSLVLY